MTKCCDEHDICYSTCNKDKEVCDVDFKRCLYKYCEGYEKNVGGTTLVKGKTPFSVNFHHLNVCFPACKGAAKVLFTGTLTLGCKAYMDAQKEACYCGISPKEKKRYKYTGNNEL